MANWQVISLDTTTPQLRAPGTGDGYSFNSGSTQLGVWTTTGLGIGTASPGVKLDVQGVVPFIRLKENTTGYLGFRGQNDSGNFYFGIDNSSGSFYGSAYARVLYAEGAYPMVFYTNATERARITSGGDVGIGTSSPNSKFEVQASAGEISRFSTSAGYRLHIYANASGSAGSGIQAQNSDLRLSSLDASTNIRFFTGNGSTETERARITSGGDFGIGTSSPGARLSVTNSNATSPTAEFGGNQVREFVRTGTQSSDSTIRVDTTFTSQGSVWVGQLVEISVASTGSGSSTPRCGVVRFAVNSLTDLQNLTSLASDLTGLTASAAVSGMELRVTFTATAGNLDSYCVYVCVVSSNSTAPATTVAIN